MTYPNPLDLDVTHARIRGEDVEEGRCVRCGSPAIRGRLTCSEVCRTASRQGDSGVIAIEGVIARPLAHAHERGIDKGTFYKRIRLGWTIREALTRPVRAKRR